MEPNETTSTPQTTVTGQVAVMLVNWIAKSAATVQLARLTAREREVLMLIARGMSNAEIARELYLGEGTVKTHVVRILAKLELRDRVQAVVFAYEHQLVRPGQGG